MNDPESDYTAWLRKAANDLLNIENNLAAEQVPWDTVCFHAQQCAEKTLKAYLVFHHYRPEHTHDLLRLLHDCMNVDPQLAAIGDACQWLTAYATTGRYPDVFEAVEEDGRRATAALERIRARVLPLFPAREAETANEDRTDG